MTRVLLTGGSGFIAAHVLEVLLQRGHSVVTTVRSQDKAQKIKDAHPKYGRDKLNFAIVEDIAQPNGKSSRKIGLKSSILTAYVCSIRKSSHIRASLRSRHSHRQPFPFQRHRHQDRPPRPRCVLKPFCSCT